MLLSEIGTQQQKIGVFRCFSGILVIRRTRFGDMHHTKFKYENKQSAITRKLNKQELRFRCTAHPLYEVYPPTKFHSHS